MKKEMSKKKILIIALIIAILVIFLLPMGITIVAYEMNFGMRVPYSPDKYELIFADFPDMERTQIEFTSNKGQTLKGYIYSQKETTQTPKALIVFSHGYMGTHQSYLSQIDYFVTNNYLVMGFDNTGCGNSDGNNMIGLAQSPVDLDYALKFVESNEKLKQYPILLYGHSWGGYAVASVLNYGHNVKAVVSRSGFSNSRDMLVEYGSAMYGNFISLLSPYAYLYEKVKFGNIVDLTGIKGINTDTDASILLLHSKDDDVISLKNSLLIHKEEYTNPQRIQTILFDDKTHDVVRAYSALTQDKEDNAQWKALVEQYGSKDKIPDEIKQKQEAGYDKTISNELDTDVMKQILDFYETSLRQ